MTNQTLLICSVTILLLNPILAVGETPRTTDQVKKESIKRLTGAAKRPGWVPGEKAIINFEFDQDNEMTGWLRENGQWHIEGWIKHNHLRCGKYRLGMRFGKGELACSNIKWLSETKYIPARTQCNQTKLHHSGLAESVDIVSKFDEVTCAQLVIHCTGICN